MSHEKEHQRIIERRWPGLWKALSAAQRPQSVEVLSAARSPTLLIDGIHLTSSYDRLAEAELQASAIGASDTSVWVYGFALGDLQRVLLDRPTIERLTVVILSPAVAFLSLHHFDHRDWLDDERVVLQLADPKSRLHAPFVLAPATLQMCSESALVLRDHLRLALAQPMQRRYFEGLTEELEARIEENRGRLEADGDVSRLFEEQGTSRIKRAVVVAAGPTLDDWLEWLSVERTKWTVIAVSTALAPLQRQGIDPDVVVIVDHRQEMASHFEHLEGAFAERLIHTPLVYAPVVAPEVLTRWPGPRLAAYLDGQHYSVPRQELPKGELYCPGTVTHAAVDLAVKMGAREVTLLGVDFCFPRQHSHVEGAAMRQQITNGQTTSSPRASTWVLNGHGERVSTETNMVGYLRDLEAYLAAHPDITFWKAGRDGAAIDGVQWLDEDLLDE